MQLKEFEKLQNNATQNNHRAQNAGPRLDDIVVMDELLNSQEGKSQDRLRKINEVDNDSGSHSKIVPPKNASTQQVV